MSTVADATLWDALPLTTPVTALPLKLPTNGKLQLVNNNKTHINDILFISLFSDSAGASFSLVYCNLLYLRVSQSPCCRTTRKNG